MFSLWRRRRQTADTKALEAALAAMQKQVDWVQSELERVAIQHQKLSGRYYRRFGAGPVPEEGLDSAHMTKDELRRAAGIIAGRPAPHK